MTTAQAASGISVASPVTRAMQDYIKAIYRLAEAGGPITTQRLADELGVSSPSVTSMVKRLHGAGLVCYTPYHGVELTTEGERTALSVLRHHRLLELFLAETLGYSWETVHAEAERLEHHVSEELEARIDAALGYPSRDPHGDPIPDRHGRVVPLPTLPLTELAPGQQATVVRVTVRDPELLRYLGALGLYPGTAVALLERHPFRGPVRVRVGDTEQIVGHDVATVVHVGLGEEP